MGNLFSEVTKKRVIHTKSMRCYFYHENSVNQLSAFVTGQYKKYLRTSRDNEVLEQIKSRRPRRSGKIIVTHTLSMACTSEESHHHWSRKLIVAPPWYFKNHLTAWQEFSAHIYVTKRWTLQTGLLKVTGKYVDQNLTCMWMIQSVFSVLAIKQI